MASELPDALDKLSLKGSRSGNSSANSLSKYFGQADNYEDIFDTVAKPLKASKEEIKCSTSSNTVSASNVDESISLEVTKDASTVSFQKTESDQPKIFSYFAESVTNKDGNGIEFFDQISQQTIPVSQCASTQNDNADLAPKSCKIENSEISNTDNHSDKESSGYCHQLKDTSSGNLLFEKSDSTPLPSIEPPLLKTATNSGLSQKLSRSSSPSIAPLAMYSPFPLGNIPLCVQFIEKPSYKVKENASSWWIPGEDTQQILNSIGNLKAVSEADEIPTTSPGVFNSSELCDPIQDLLRNFDGEVAAANRNTVTADMVTQDDRGIRELIQGGYWRAAINLCGRLLTAYGQGYGRAGISSKHTPHSLQLWFTRIALLVKTQQTEIAAAELSTFGSLDAPDLYYQFYPELYGSKRGSMVPFSFRLLAAEMPLYLNKMQEAEDKICQLLNTVKKIIKRFDYFIDPEINPSERNEALELWSAREVRVVHSLVNCALLQKSYHNAVRLVHQCIQRPTSLKGPLYSILGRVYLLLGDVHRAQQAFNLANDSVDNSQVASSITAVVDAALIAMAQNAFSEAHNYFKEALALEPDNPMLVNNAAVCLLYLGRMQDAMLMLEENLGTKPNTMIHDPTVLNVCTLYELESSLTTQRKLGMLRLASQWRADSLNASCFKLQN